MYKLYTFLRWATALLFIFSGLVKAIDPQGLSYKMQEFFEVWGISQANPVSLPLAVLMNVLEIAAGVALLLEWRPRLTHRFLFLLIVFFTFLTGYAALSGRFSSCGCFGDCLPLKPMTSFYKDLLLLLAISTLLWMEKKWSRASKVIIRSIMLGVSVAASFLLQVYALVYLPPVDCLPYRPGNNLLELMKAPPGALADSFDMQFIYKKDGKEIQFSAGALPDNLDSSYEFLDRRDLLVRPATGKPRIADLNIKTYSGTDTLQPMLGSGKKYTLLLIRDINSRTKSWITEHGNLLPGTVYLITSNGAAVSDLWPAERILLMDYTVLKTFARAPLVIAEMNGPVVEKKYVPRY